MKITYFLLVFTLTAKIAGAQTMFTKPSHLNVMTDDSTKTRIFNHLDSLFSQIEQGKVNDELISKKNFALNKSIFYSLRGMEENTQEHVKDFYKMQIINCYPLPGNQYHISIAYISDKVANPPVLRALITLIAAVEDKKVSFSIPLAYQTQYWKKKVVGNVTYHYQDNLNKSVAALFDKKNTQIANRLGLAPDKFDFYLCNNYQDILRLLGYTYDLESNGRTRDGYGVDSHTIFSIIHSEDFSHDIFHFYSAKIRTNPRNSTAEEGFAYSWGNAYYTDTNGKMITQKALVKELKLYLLKHPDIDLWTLFNSNPKIFNAFAKEISVKSVISGLICDDVEKQKGIEGVKLLLNCGRGDINYLREVEVLIQVNQSNFNLKVMQLIEKQ